MHDPDFKERERELFEALKTSFEVREFYGIADNGDGTYWVQDLQKINSMEEGVKNMLRSFLKLFGKKPEPQVIHVHAGNTGMTPETRRRLDELYRKLDRLSLQAPARKYN